MKVRDIMRPDPFAVGETDALGVAHAAMARHHIRHLPVLGEGRVVGILSERDVLAARARGNGESRWWKLPVRDAMTHPVQTAGPDDSLTEVAGRMAAAKIGALPIVERGKLLAIVTIPDVLAAEVRAAMGGETRSTAIAADIMTPLPSTVPPEAGIERAVEIMAERQVRHLPVVDGTSTIVGMLSERDVRAAVGPPGRYLDQRGPLLTVHQVMTTPATVVRFDRPVHELANEFADDRLDATPVVDQFGALVGIISYVDILRALAR